MVARMSWWPDTSSSDTGRYFSTLIDGQQLPLFRHKSGFAHQGRLSSASTGRFAALRLPLVVVAAEKAMSLEGWTSMSISSSKSDILMAVLCGFCGFGVARQDGLSGSRSLRQQKRAGKGTTRQEARTAAKAS